MEQAKNPSASPPGVDAPQEAGSSSAAPPAASQPSASSAALPPTVIEAWVAFDLTSRREGLDAAALEIAGRQETSAASRKKLADRTREFKKGLAEGKATNKSTGALVKAYQAELDALTQRSKAAEANFLNVYRALYDAPDPVAELRSAAEQRSATAELREERAAILESAALAKKHETRVAELEQALAKAEQSVAEEVRKALDAKQAEWMSAQHKAIEAYELREQELLHQISLGNKSSRALKAGSDRAQQQANEVRSALEEMKKSRQVESEMVLEDLEKARNEAGTLRRRCAELEERYQADGNDAEDGGGNSAIGASALSAELAARDVEVSQLRDQVHALEGVLGGKDAEKSSEFAKLTETIRTKDTTIGEMKKKLDKLPTIDEYETLKRQYETLRSFQLNEADVADDGESEEASGATEDGLERRLLAKVKALEGKLTRLRMELVDRDGRITNLTTTNTRLEEQVTDHKALISRLEDGINAMTGDAGSRGSRKGGEAASQSEASADDWDWGEQREAAGLTRIMQAGSGGTLEPSMLDIVSGQRDRFRARTLELESENRKLVERVDKLSADMDSLKGDNVRLYGKIRFVQNYRGGAGAAPLAAAEAGVAGPEDSDNAAVLGRYRKMYEDMSNPYTLFSRRERHKRMNEMSAPERLTMRAGQRAMATKSGRLVAFSYVLALHLLVVLVLSTASMHSCDVATAAVHKAV